VFQGNVALEGPDMQDVVDFYTRHTGDWHSHKYYIKAVIDDTSCVPDKGEAIALVDPLSPAVTDAELWKVATFLMIGRRKK
jgi:hypothetical protein